MIYLGYLAATWLLDHVESVPRKLPKSSPEAKFGELARSFSSLSREAFGGQETVEPLERVADLPVKPSCRPAATERPASF